MAWGVIKKMSVYEIRKKLREYYYKIEKVPFYYNRYKLINFNKGAYCGEYTIEELEKLIADLESDNKS